MNHCMMFRRTKAVLCRLCAPFSSMPLQQTVDLQWICCALVMAKVRGMHYREWGMYFPQQKNHTIHPPILRPLYLLTQTRCLGGQTATTAQSVRARDWGEGVSVQESLSGINTWLFFGGNRRIFASKRCQESDLWRLPASGIKSTGVKDVATMRNS